jgi:hypothetical protein
MNDIKKIIIDEIFENTLEDYLIQVRLLLKDQYIEISDDEAERFLYLYLKEIEEAKCLQ